MINACILVISLLAYQESIFGSPLLLCVCQRHPCAVLHLWINCELWPSATFHNGELPTVYIRATVWMDYSLRMCVVVFLCMVRSNLLHVYLFLYATLFQFVQCTSEDAFAQPHCYMDGTGFLPISPCPETVKAYPGSWLTHVRWDEMRWSMQVLVCFEHQRSKTDGQTRSAADHLLFHLCLPTWHTLLTYLCVCEVRLVFCCG